MTATIPPAIGQPLSRVDGRAKVSGTARYASEIPVPDMAYAYVVGSRIAAGRVIAIDTSAALAEEGVLAVLTHQTLPKIAEQPPLIPSLAGTAAPGQTFFPLQDDTVHYAGQQIALVVADTWERAQYAARLLRVSYAETPPVTTLDQGRGLSYEPERIFGGWVPGRIERGDVEAGLREADVRVGGTYTYAANHHHPIEPSCTTAQWDGDDLLLYDATQGVNATQMTVSRLLGVPMSRIRVIGHYAGGSFGSKAMIHAHPTLAAMAARAVGRPVKLVLTREQMFTSVGHREEQEQHITLGATHDGRLTAVRHHKLSPTSHFDDWAEPSVGTSSQIYACPHYEGVYRLFRANTMTPTFMRAPGEASGMVALECSLDELAHELGLDPIELRLRNHTDVDAMTGLPWSSSGLRECYERGAQRFGWAGRDPRPGTRRDGNWLIGTGMATACYPVAPLANPQRARARLYADGTAVVQAATPDFGTGVATVMAQVAADGLGVSVERCRFENGDTDLPNIAAAVGSAGAGMISAAVHSAASALRRQLIRSAVGDPGSPLHGADPVDVVVHDGVITAGTASESYSDLLRRTFRPDAEAAGQWKPPAHDTPYAMMTFGAQFAEVAVDAELGLVRVRRMTGAFAPGRVLNPKTARSQLMGGMLWGLGQALLEANHMRPDTGRWVNSSLGEYLVPVNADAPDVDVELIEVEDDIVNPLGVKGVGEIGQVGAAAAIANAVHHATGRRVRRLPIMIEDLL
ncbi:xanthine dehydrogenase family protein molybdopterin-binding subunit [Streptomyces chromofuscus]|uniref:Xanthine dehydrogenase family protein molybdopterin-binding subunit n=1 Tax=Streptomyces chromofuscus TaxID=42881 RepID=A0A7M2T8I6_STRCW|nr:xanthine dehydrogenase family protein molybdopterin-binding subunit [Streptomyces chromofuscus]QOV45017.1 xanthine dehydrogenase family protein molybdopterin-binding subunit [Streptomyces chromofuscus]GGT28351.1 carbon-monoxide dehydrogenase large subunit [Streptomyces chromofuscus]